MLKITLLGSGNSSGVPAAGNHWGKCDPKNPKNQRSRACLSVQSDTTTIIIDTGADFRQQMNGANIAFIDAVFLTHDHSDHINGIDDLRAYFFKRDQRPVPVYMQTETKTEINRRFPYLTRYDALGLYPPIVEFKIVETTLNQPATHQIGDIDFITFLQDHGTCTTLGFRFGDVGYSTDMVNLNDTAIQSLKGIKTWIVDGAAYHQPTNPVHANLESIYALNKQIGASQVYITNLTPSMDYETLCAELPEGYRPAYDGLLINLK
jgi:phosphoribosyl 1,2-cyclic phosphate phosphodiesterase